MANFYRDIRNSLNNIERDQNSRARSAAQSAQSNAATSRAAQSASAGVWASAGFQAVTAFQSARAVRAAEERAALHQQEAAASQHTANEQAVWNQFATWRQTPEGVAFMEWQGPAFQLGQILRNRDSEWFQSWAQTIGQAQADVSAEEKEHVIRQPGRLKRTGLKTVAIISIVLAGFAAIGLLLQITFNAFEVSSSAKDDFSYADCQAALADPDNFLISEENCEAINPVPAGSISQHAVPLTLFLGLSLTFTILRKVKQRVARTDQTLANEAEARVARWLFDPLAVAPGYIGFTWYESPNDDGYADRLMELAFYDGHGRPPAQSELLPLYVPTAHERHDSHPAEVNALLTRYAQEYPAIN